MNARRIRAIDLCCGAGGWAVAAQGLPIDWIAVADMDALCIETWRINHGHAHPNCARLVCDLATPAGFAAIRESCEEASIDLVVGGIPCEQISVARGNRKASAIVMSQWHALLDNCLDLVRRLNPRWWVIEDVIQIDKHLPLPLFNGQAIRVTRLQAADFGPQQRLRSFVGDFPCVSRPRQQRVVRDCLRPGPHLAIAHAERYERLTELRDGRISIGNTAMRVLATDGKCPTLLTSVGHRGGRNRREFVVIDEHDRPRQLSWQEAAIVQGFPEDYLFADTMTGAMAMIGRAIPIYVGRAILETIVADARAFLPKEQERQG